MEISRKWSMLGEIMFLIDVTYKQDLTAVDAHLAAHRAHLARAIAAGKLILAGRKNPRTGGLMLVRMASREEVDSFIAGDAFFTEGVADYRVTEWVPTVWAEEFEKFTLA